MPIQRTDINSFLELAETVPILDVRSPGEFEQAHIPGAYSLPLFSNEQRKVVGTAYKQESRENAIKIGLDYFGPNMRSVVEEVEKLTKSKSGEVLIHCWRGGMRSGAIAWLLDLYGFKVTLLEGGYKAYRNWVLAQFEVDYNFKIIGGYTGSAKTDLLHDLANKNYATVNLEGIAHHRGSALGGINQPPQPSQEMFENILATHLFRQQNADFIFLEDESQRIGNMQIPNALWETMKKSTVYFFDIPFEERLDYLIPIYGEFPKEQLANAIERIKKRLGGLETKNALAHLENDDFKSCFRILLTYYDRWYLKGVTAKDSVVEIPSPDVDIKTNSKKILEKLN
ncbi:MAG: tRNA 2-selenouridine(34) synthase MnmH [Spirosomaceae bacterium]|nr:tRNA 2-selenouridine(34) synthase MnmH [Spirosomataceae bacterium]